MDALRTAQSATRPIINARALGPRSPESSGKGAEVSARDTGAKPALKPALRQHLCVGPTVLPNIKRKQEFRLAGVPRGVLLH